MKKTVDNLDIIFSSAISELQERGIIYLMVIIAVIIAIFIIYDKDNDDSKVFSSFTRCIRRFIILVADVTGDIISIFSSLSEILNLIRILVFGKVDSQTQIFLANYAVIFMSVVSYFTSMSGLSLVLASWQAVLASFGIQVGILVFSGRLSQLIASNLPDSEKGRYVYRIKETTPNYSCNCGNGQQKCSKLFTKRTETTQTKENEKISNIKNSPYEWIGIALILLSLIMCSSFFSYTAFWEKFVLPGVPLNEYASAKVSANEAEEEYSKSLKEYQQQLENILHRVNNLVLENVDINPIILLESQIQSIDHSIDDYNTQIQEKEAKAAEFEVGSPEMNRIDDELDELEDELKQLNAEKKSMEDALYSSYEYTINESINFLSSFYADPLNEGISFDEVRTNWGKLQSAISQMDETKNLFTTKQKVDLDSTLDNYLELCRYYRDNGFTGFKMSTLISSEPNGMPDALSTSEEYRKETERILQHAIESLEAAPSFISVDSIWDKGVIEETSKTSLLEKLYGIYRNCSEQVQATEKAIKSLASLLPFSKSNSEIMQSNHGIVFFVLVLAIFIDCTIVFISIWKGNKSTNRSFSELRRLVGILFIRREKGRDEDARRMQLSVAFGLLFGVLMFVLQQLIPSINGEWDDKLYWMYFMYCACGLLAAIIIGKAIGRSQDIVKKDIPNNKIYLLRPVDEETIKQYVHPSFIEVLDKVERKTVCVINAQTAMLEKEKNAACIKVSEVKDKNWYMEFSMLESYKIVSISDNNEYYIIKDAFWKMLYNNILNKMSGNLMLPMSVEDLVNYEDSEENNS